MSTQSKTQSDPAAMENRLEIVGQLAAGIAHEINTPVQYVGDNVRYVSDEIDTLLELLNKYRELGNLIEGDGSLKHQFKELAEKEDLEFLIEEVPAALAQTIKGIESIAGIVRSLKSLVHPGGTEKVPTDVNVAVNHAVTLSRAEWKYCAEVDLELGTDLPQVLCYAGELNQVLINLLVNAAHAVQANQDDALGKIKVSTFVYKNSVGITVEDSGTGIPLEIQHRVFDPFLHQKT